MGFQLVEVEGHLSLEMAAEDFDDVWSYIKHTYPDVRTELAGHYERFSFGGAEFLHEREWDQPCLLSETAEGDALLKAIADHFR